jgi:hypothetical protein
MILAPADQMSFIRIFIHISNLGMFKGKCNLGALLPMLRIRGGYLILVLKSGQRKLIIQIETRYLGVSVLIS